MSKDVPDPKETYDFWEWVIQKERGNEDKLMPLTIELDIPGVEPKEKSAATELDNSIDNSIDCTIYQF